MKRAFLATETIACLAVGQGRAQDSASGPSPDVPELTALSGHFGKWDCRFEVNPIEGVTEGRVHAGPAQGEWILGGRFLRQTWSIEATPRVPGMSGSSIMTYDPAKKGYRSWQFASNGSTIEGVGSYEAKAKTMTWTARDADGFRTLTKASFAEEGVENWTIVVRGPDGKVVADMKGKNTRRMK